jgi:CBS domain-containing protein
MDETQTLNCMDIFVKDMMKKQIVSIDVSSTVEDAAKMMKDTGVSCLIVTQKNIPIGILTERDFVTRVASLANPLSTSVRVVMSLPLISIRPGDTARKLAELMKEKKIHKIPVVDGNQLVGIVTATDLITKCIIDSDMEMRQICNSFSQMAF